MQMERACPTPLLLPAKRKRQRHNAVLYERVIKPLTDLYGTPDDHYQNGEHVEHTAVWEAAQAEVQQRLDDYYNLRKVAD